MASTSSLIPSSKLLINRRRQEGNPVLKYIRNVAYEFSSDIKVDFECFTKCGLLYLSLRYHKLHPSYIETRVTDAVGYSIKVLLLLVNVEDPSFLLRDLNMFCYRTGLTLVLCHSVEEVAEYIENFKICEKKNPETVIGTIKARNMNGQPLKERNEQLFDNAVELLSSIRTISQSDSKRMLWTFGSISSISRATIENLTLNAGLGPKKAENIFNFFRSRFFVS